MSARLSKAGIHRPAGVPVMTAVLDLDRFWGIIERSQRGGSSPEAQGARLIALLEQLQAEEIIALERLAVECRARPGATRQSA